MYSSSKRSSTRKRNESKKTNTAHATATATVTQTVVTSTTKSSSQQQRSSTPTSQEARKEWKKYPWEKSPKTGYTYADSGSYRPDRLESPYIMPNMSRVGLGRRSPSAYSHSEGYTRSHESANEMSFSSTTCLDHSEDELTEAEESYHDTEERESAMTVVTSMLTYLFTSIVHIVTTVVITSVHTVTSFATQLRDSSSERQASSSESYSSLHTKAQVTSTDTASTSAAAAGSASQASVNSSGASHASAGIISKSSSSTSMATVASSVASTFSSMFGLIYSVVTTVVSTVASILTYPIRAASYLLSSGATSGASWLGAKIYRLVSWTTLTDAWLLSRVYEFRRRGCCCCLFPLLLLLPILIPGSHYLYEHGSAAWLRTGLLAGQKEAIAPLPATNDTTVILQHIQNMWVLLKEQQESSQVYLSQEQIEALVRGIVDPKFSAQGTRWQEQQEKNDDILSRLAKIKELDVLLLGIQQKHDELSAELSKTSANVKQGSVDGEAASSASLAAIQELQLQLGGLEAQLGKLRQAHEAELTAVKGCCQDKDTVLALIREQVHTGTAGFVSDDHLKERLDRLQTQLDTTMAALKVQIDSRPVASASDTDTERSGIDASQVDALIAAQLAKYDSKLAELKQSLDEKISSQSPQWDEKLAAFAENYNKQLISIQKTYDTKLTELKSQVDLEVVDQMKLSDKDWSDKLEAVRREMADLKDYADARFAELKSSIDVTITSTGSAQDEKLATLISGSNDKLMALQTTLESAVSELNTQMDSKLGALKSGSDKGKEEQIALLTSELEKMKLETNNLIVRLRTDFDSRIHSESTEDERKLLAQIVDLEQKLVALRADMEKKSADSEKAVDAKLALFMQRMDSTEGGVSEFGKRLGAFMEQVNQRFINLEENLREEIKQQVLMAVTNTYKNYTINEQKQTVIVSPSTGDGRFTEKDIKQLINEALKKFGADKTGMVDFALESSGGSVVSTRCTETYRRSTALMSLLGIPLFYMNNTPRTAIQPDMQPGQCWAFKGVQGFLVIQLSDLVQPTKFTMEHIPRSLSADGEIKSAPKDFTVWGLQDEHDTAGIHLGNYTYEDNGESLQTFDSQAKDKTAAYRVVELKIHSNHGNEEYTCLYRFRVHGDLQRP